MSILAILGRHGLGSTFGGVRRCGRASPCRRIGAPRPRDRGDVDRADRRPPRPLGGDDQGRTSSTRRARKPVQSRPVIRGCGASTHPRNGKGDAYAYCKRCHPGAIKRKWTPELLISAMLEWRERYGPLPSSYDWSRTHARRRGARARRRLNEGQWPPASVVSALFGTWATARRAADTRAVADCSPDQYDDDGPAELLDRCPSQV